MRMAQNAGGLCEIEVKYRVLDLDRVQDALAGRGIALSAPTHQDDQAYAPRWWEYGQSKLGVPFARLRTGLGGGLQRVSDTYDSLIRAAHAASRQPVPDGAVR